MKFPIFGVALALAGVGASASEWRSLPSPPLSGSVWTDSVMLRWDANLGRWKWASVYTENWEILPDLGFGKVDFLQDGRRIYFQVEPVRYLDLGSDSLRVIYGCRELNPQSGSCSNDPRSSRLEGGFLTSDICAFQNCYLHEIAVDSVLPGQGKVLIWRTVNPPNRGNASYQNRVIFSSRGDRSADSGQTWRRYPTPWFFRPFRSDTIAFRMELGRRMALSLDNGATWDTSKVLDSSIIDVDIQCFVPQLSLWAEVEVPGKSAWDKIYSFDSGRSWLKMAAPRCSDDSISIPTRNPSPFAGPGVLQAAPGGFLALPKLPGGSARLLRWNDKSWTRIRDTVDAATAGDYGIRVATRAPSTGGLALQVSADGTSWTTTWDQASSGAPFQSAGNGKLVLVDNFQVGWTFDGGLNWASVFWPTYQPDNCKLVRSIDSASFACWSGNPGDGTLSFYIKPSWRHASYCDTTCTIAGFEPNAIAGLEATSGVLATSLGFVQTTSLQRFGGVAANQVLVSFRDTVLALNESGAWVIHAGTLQSVARTRFPSAVVAGAWASVGDLPESGLAATDSTLILVDSSGVFWYRTGTGASDIRHVLSHGPSWSLVGRRLRLELAVPARVRVDLSDPRGRTEAILSETRLQPGIRMLALPSDGTGVRFLRVSVDGVPQPTMAVSGLGRN